MEIDLRNEAGVNPSLIHLDANSLNAIIEYCQKRAIDSNTVTVVHFAETRRSLDQKIGWASAIAQKLGAVVHFSHTKTPITAYPTIRDATVADYQRRAAAGELIPGAVSIAGEQCDDS